MFVLYLLYLSGFRGFFSLSFVYLCGVLGLGVCYCCAFVSVCCCIPRFLLCAAIVFVYGCVFFLCLFLGCLALSCLICVFVWVCFVGVFCLVLFWRSLLRLGLFVVLRLCCCLVFV